MAYGSYGKAPSAGIRFAPGPYSKQVNAKGAGKDDIPCMVHVGSLPYSVRWQDLKEHMSQAGTVAFARVITKDGTDFGWSTGSGVVRYETPAEARKAIVTLSESTLRDRQISVNVWSGSPFLGRKDAAGGVYGDPATIVYVGNLSYKTQWKYLQDHMSQAGNVQYGKVLTEDGSDWGWSKGAGCVRYATAAEANAAIVSLNGSELEGRSLVVDHWAAGSRSAQ